MKRFRVVPNDDDSKREYHSKKDRQIRRSRKLKKNFQKRKAKFLDDLENDLERNHVN